MPSQRDIFSFKFIIPLHVEFQMLNIPSHHSFCVWYFWDILVCVCGQQPSAFVDVIQEKTERISCRNIPERNRQHRKWNSSWTVEHRQLCNVGLVMARE